ncbi:o-succinylbenzoate synthase [Halobacteriales archaeon SW_5_70_135]|nr:MAG: o-succinylbenzoate synthase [Halobacteriales archaeon SW_5_70_135]
MAPYRVDRRPFAVDLARPLSTAAGTIDRREGWLVRVRTTGAEDDPTGVGEATPLPGWTESTATCRETLRARAGDALAESRRDLLTGVDGPAARHGLALALADLAARRDGRPLWAQILDCDDGGDGDDRGERTVRANATVGDAPPGATVDRAREAVERGFDCLKLKVGARSVEADLERLAAVRDAVGDGVRLRADANAAWDCPVAERAFDGVAERALDLEYVEQPLDATALAGHAALRERERRRAGGGTDVALDESLAEVAVDRVLAADAADAVVLKPMALGGPDRALAAARAAHETGVRAVVTTTVDAVVARTAATHVAAAVDAVDPRSGASAHGLATADALAADLGPDPAPVETGRVRLATASGTGVDPEVFEE